MKKIMILGASLLQLPAIKKAQEMGLQVIAVDMDPNAVGFKEPGVISEIISTIDTEKILLAAKKHQIDGITTICTDLPMRSVARVCRELGLPGISEEAAFNATNKAAMRKCLKDKGVPVPNFIIVNTKDEYLQAVKEFNTPFVVKAVDNSGSRGIELIKDVKDFDTIVSAFDYCKSFSKCGDLVLEEFMDGPEVCVETLNINGKCYPIQITDQLAKKPPYFTDAGYSQPSLLDNNIKEQIKNIAIAANLALENYNGSSCTEIIVTDKGPKVVELGPRLAGDCMTTHLVPLSTGVDMVKSVINIAMGMPVDIKRNIDKGSCIRFFMEPVIGKIKEIKGINEAEMSKGVIQVTMTKKVGDIATELRGSGDRIGFVIAQGDNAQDAIINCENALKKITVNVENE